MADAGTRYTDRQQQILERRMRKVYAEAQEDLQAKLDEYMRKHKARDKVMRAKLDRGEITKAQYNSWMQGQVFMGDQWRAKVKQMTDTLTDANRQSLNILRGGQIDVFGENATYEAFQIEKNFGVNFGFGIYDSNTVARLLKDQPELLPRKTVNGKKDAAWNKTKIANCVTQGILQGESIDQIAKRMARDTSSTNMKAMVRYARTAMTGAQNAGRINMLNKAVGMGISIKKKWMATFDNRTRDAHRDLDGQTADVSKPFQSELGPIMYPGDPQAHPGNVYNCRCTLVYEYLDYPAEYERYDNIEGHPVKEMTYNEWKGFKQLPRIEESDYAELINVKKKSNNEVILEWENLIDKQTIDIVDKENSDVYFGSSINTSINNALRANPYKSIEDIPISEFGGVLSSNTRRQKFKDAALSLDKITKDNPLRNDTILTRREGYGYITKVLKVSEEQLNKYISDFNSVESQAFFKSLVGLKHTESAFMSTSGTESRKWSAFTDAQVRLKLFTPRGTPAYITNPGELEVLLGRNTSYTVVGFEPDYNSKNKIVGLLLKCIINK